MMDLCEGYVARGHQTVITTARKDGVANEITDSLHYLAGCKPEHYSRKWNNLAHKKIAEIHQANQSTRFIVSDGANGVVKWQTKTCANSFTWHGTSLSEL